MNKRYIIIKNILIFLNSTLIGYILGRFFN